MPSITRFPPRRSIAVAFFVLHTIQAWSITPAMRFIEAKFISGMVEFQAGQQAEIENQSKRVRKPAAKPECVLQMFVQVNADSRRAGTSDDGEHALALARGEVFKRALEKNGFLGAALAPTYVSFTKVDRNVDTAMFMVMYAPAARYSATGGIEAIEGCWSS